MTDDIDELLVKRENLPDKPGIYMYKGKSGTIIYIGKAKSIAKRVPQYFQSKWFGNTHDEILYGEKLRKLVANIADIDFIVTDSEKEALILENDMIKKYQPKFNVLLKDDKSFPWLMITYSEKFPRILIIRQPEKIQNFDNKDIHSTKNKFFGPYIDVRPMKNTLKFLRHYFPYCTCKRPCEGKKRPCINYQIKLCPAPCAGKISEEDYLENIESIDRILNGDVAGIIIDMQKKMEETSKEMHYELAAKYRDTIKALGRMTEKQAIVNYDEPEKINRDIIGYYKTLKKIGILLMHVRNGRLTGKTPYIIESDEKMDTDEEILISFLEQYFMGVNRSIPDEIIIPDEFMKKSGTSEEKSKLNILKSRTEPLILLLEERNKKKLKIRFAGKTGYTRSLLRIANKNVQLMIRLEHEYEKMMTEADALSDLGMNKEEISSMKKQDRESLAALKEAKDILGFDDLPRIIEGFDISNWSQGDATGSLVCFIDGKPVKSNYRSYIIRDPDSKGDYGMMQEVVERRYKRILKENGILPDLIVMDGGKAQVNAAKEILKNLGLEKLPIIGLKKKDIHTKIDEVVFGNEKEPIKITVFTPGFRLLQSISDEYHRRAIQHHKKRMAKRLMSSELDEINGIGEKIKQKLFDQFGNIEKIKNATIEDIQALFGEKRGAKLYSNIQEAFSKSDENDIE